MNSHQRRIRRRARARSSAKIAGLLKAMYASVPAELLLFDRPLFAGLTGRGVVEYAVPYRRGAV